MGGLGRGVTEKPVFNRPQWAEDCGKKKPGSKADACSSDWRFLIKELAPVKEVRVRAGLGWSWYSGQRGQCEQSPAAGKVQK